MSEYEKDIKTESNAGPFRCFGCKNWSWQPHYTEMRDPCNGGLICWMLCRDCQIELVNTTLEHFEGHPLHPEVSE